MPSKEIENSNIAAELQPTDDQAASAIDAAVEVSQRHLADALTGGVGKSLKEDEESKDAEKQQNEVLSAILQAHDGEEQSKDEAEAEAAAAAAIADATKEDGDDDEPAKKKQKVSSGDKKDKDFDETPVVGAQREQFAERAVQRKESHKEVERRRRETINTAINELRDLCSGQLHAPKPANGGAATSASQVTHSKSEVLNAACNYIKELKNKLSALDMDFENYKSVSRVEMNNVTSAKDALEEALANEKKN